MNSSCAVCGCTEVEAIADARSLGLSQELQSGVYTCCQIVEWADEQLLAWFQAAHEDSKQVEDLTKPLESEPTEAVAVPVRLRRRVPWYRDPEGQS
jgi:hypothetical protein